MKITVFEEISKEEVPVVMGYVTKGEHLSLLHDGYDLLKRIPDNNVRPITQNQENQAASTLPFQVNVYANGDRLGLEGKADIRHAELRQDLHAVKKSVDGVGQAVAAVKRDNEDLLAMQAAGLFKFMVSVEPSAMCLFLRILQYGDQSKAARSLNMSDGAFRERTKAWASMSRPYRVMYRLIAWRKGVSRKEIVSFDDNLLHKIRQGEDREEILREVLEGLAEMDSGNWPNIRDELEATIKEVVE